MNKLVLLLLAFAFTSQAENKVEQCKNFGKKAYLIMLERQKNKPLIELYESYQSEEDKKIVIDAYREPHHDMLGQLMRSIESFGEIRHAAESRKYDTIKALFDDTTEGFRNKYIAICFNDVTRKTGT